MCNILDQNLLLLLQHREMNPGDKIDEVLRWKVSKQHSRPEICRCANQCTCICVILWHPSPTSLGSCRSQSSHRSHSNTCSQKQAVWGSVGVVWKHYSGDSLLREGLLLGLWYTESEWRRFSHLPVEPPMQQQALPIAQEKPFYGYLCFSLRVETQ